MKNFLLKIFILLIISNNPLFNQIKDEILPVELIYFEAIILSNVVLLRWGTATEVNNYGFEIQRAFGNQSFEYVDFVFGSGNSNSPKHYFYVDTTLTESGLYSYRLKQIDFDGDYHFSDTVQVFVSLTGIEIERSINNSKIKIHDLLSTKELIIEINDESIQGEIKIFIYNILGQRIKEMEFYSTSFPISINYSNFSSGIYFFNVQNNGRVLFSQKFKNVR